MNGSCAVVCPPVASAGYPPLKPSHLAAGKFQFHGPPKEIRWVVYVEPAHLKPRR